MEQAAQMAEELQPDLIDINCGCWVRNVVGQGAGAGLLRDLQKMRSIITSVVKSVQLPVTVKTRLGWDEKSVQIVDVATMIEDAGAQALTIHCRTRAQGHKGNPDYSWVPKVKQAVQIPIIVNGGIESAESAKTVFDVTGCDGIMIARGAIQNPWIFSETKQYLRTGEHLPLPSIQIRVKTLFEHLRLSVENKGERLGVIEFRKYYGGYLRDLPGVSKLRTDLMRYTELQPVVDRIEQFISHDSSEPFLPIEETLAA